MRSKRWLTMLLAFAMILSVVSPAAMAVAPVENSVMNPGEEPEVVEETKGRSPSIDSELVVSGEDTQANGANTLKDEDKLMVDLQEVETVQGEGSWSATKVDVDLDLPLTDVPACVEELQEAAAYFEAREKVVAFVVMEEAPLSEKVSTLSLVDEASEADLLAVQDKVIDEIETDILAGEDLEVRYQFTYLTNSFSVETEFENLEQIAMIDGVKSVFVMPVYEACTTTGGTASPLTASSGEMTGVAQVWENLGYTGSGMKIAIIDTGLDLDHPSFAADPALGERSMTLEDVEAVLSDLNAADIYAGLTAEDLYRSAKVPYAFNYVDASLTADHSRDSQGDHGTHVAGIAAANALDTTTVVGMAPDAQLVIMKVFGANGGAYMDDITAALEDAMTLGCDVVNASLGSPAGFSSSDTELDLIYERLASQDIVANFSAGNEGHSADENMWGTDLNNTDNPDNATVGSPSTYANVMSIASAENSEVMTPYFSLADGTQVFYNGSYEYYYGKVAGMESLAGQELEYVIIDGLGYEENFYDADGNSLVEGKVAVVMRGETTFGSKIYNAELAGAAACIIWNNNSTDDVFNFYISTTLEDGESIPSIPCCLISLADGQTMADAETKTLVVSAEEAARKCDGGQMSTFSSWGVSPDLRLVPDITGVGGNVYSCYDGGEYGLMSGTSMSSPQVAGVSALVMQYLYEVYPDAPDGSVREVAEALLMSTADPIIDTESGVEASPRQQGAGLVDAYEAVTSESYLTVNGARPKAELGDSSTGKYTFGFEIHNFSDEAKTYTMSGTILTEGVVAYDVYPGEYFMAGYDVALSGSVTFDKESVTVAPGKTANVKVTVELSDDDKAYFAECWENGGYVEGYVYLTNEEGVVELNLPYMGFYGDWTDAPIFDTAYWYSNSLWGAGDGSVDGHEFWHVFWTGEESMLGINPYSGAIVDADYNIVYDPAHNVVSPNGDGVIDGIDEIYLSLLRNAKTLTFTYTVDGEVVDRETITNNSKTMYMSSYGQVVPWLYSWYGEGMYDFTDAEGNLLADGTEVILTIDAALDYKSGGDNTMTVPMYVDTTAPELVNVYEMPVENDDGTVTYYLVVEASDITDMAAAYLMNSSGSRIYSVAYDYQMQRTEDGTWMAAFDVTDLGTKLMVALCDYGANEGYYNVTYTSAGDNLPDMTGFAEDLFAYRVFDDHIYSDHMYGWVSMNKPASAEENAAISVWTDDYMEYAAINAAEYVDGKIFAVDAVYNLVVMDPGLFDRQTVCNLGVNVIDMTFDDSTDTMYVLSKQGNYMYLYSMDLLTGELTQLKYYGYYTSKSPWAIADDDNGTIYAIKYNSDVLYYLDTANSYALTELKYDVDGVATSVKLTDSTGAAAKPSAYAQSITYSDGKLYWAYFKYSYYGNVSDMVVIDTADWSTYAVPYMGLGYDADYNLVEYYPVTELVGLLTLEETEYQIPESTELSEVIVSDESLLMKVGDTVAVTLNCLPWNYEVQEITWSSSDENVATVVDGKVTGVGEGNAVITVVADGIEASIDVRVVLVEGSFSAYNLISNDGYYGTMIDVDLATMDYYLKAEPPVDFISGDYNGHDGCYYGYTEDGQLYRWNMVTDEVKAVGTPADNYATDMAYDYSSGLMYALYTDLGSYESKICVVNMNTGVTAVVSNWTADYGMYGLFTLACDSKGMLYMLDYDGYLYSYEIATATPGYAMYDSLGSISYAQSMCWDHSNEVLLWAHCDGTSINWIDVAEGFMLKLGDPTESGLFEFVGLYTVPETIMELPYTAVESVVSNDMLLLVGATRVADVTVYPFNATNLDLVLTSADESVASVANGMVTGVGEGETTISYTLTDGETVYEGSFNVTVLQGADNIYGHLMGDLGNSAAQYWMNIIAEDTTNPNYLAYTDWTIFAEEHVDGKIYAYGYDSMDWEGNWQYMVIDAATFEILEQTDMGESFPYVYDMTYDYATGTMYAVAGASESDTNLYVVNMDNGAVTLLMQTEQKFMSIGAVRDGILYAIENSVQELLGYDDWGWEIYGLSNAQLYSINVKTLEIEYVGDTGMQCNMIASMAYDYDTDVMYWTPLSHARNGGNGVSGLAIVDLETGAATNLGLIGSYGSQVGGLYIVADEYPEVDTSELYHVLLTPAKSGLNVGQTVSLSLNTIPMNLDGAEVVWATSNKRVATVDENGVVTALMQGKAEITATVTYNGQTMAGTATVSVLAEDASFLSWNKTDMGWSEISRADYSVTNLTEGEEVGVSAIAVVGTDVYGFDLNNGFFKLDTETYERTYISEELSFDPGAEFDEGYEYAFMVRDMGYDAANGRMLALGATNMYDPDSGSYDELYDGCSIYSVDLTTGEMTKLYTMTEHVNVYSMAVGTDGTVYFYTTFDDGIYVLDLDQGTITKLVTLQSQSLYGEPGYDIRHAMHYDDLTDTLFMTFTSNAKYYRMILIDPITGSVTAYNENSDQMFIGEIVEVNWAYTGDLFSGLTFVNEYFHVCEFGEWTVTTEATCTEAGVETRECECGEIETREPPATGHAYTSEFVWSEDNASCELVFTCGNCADTYSETCTVTTETTEATCEEDGLTVYTATCEVDGVTYTDTVEVVIEATGHDYNFFGKCKVCGEKKTTSWWDDFFGGWWDDEEEEEPTEPSVPETTEPEETEPEETQPEETEPEETQPEETEPEETQPEETEPEETEPEETQPDDDEEDSGDSWWSKFFGWLWPFG